MSKQKFKNGDVVRVVSVAPGGDPTYINRLTKIQSYVDSENSYITDPAFNSTGDKCSFWGQEHLIGGSELDYIAYKLGVTT